ncbi:MAG: sialidase family protein, partial [Acidimicrobiales bacterium]
AWGRNSTLYSALEGYGTGEGGTAGHASILLARSTNLGQSWSTTVVDNNRGKTGVAPTDNGVTGLAVDTSGSQDVVYVGFTQSYPKAPKGSPLQNSRVDVAVSTNGGTSFARTVNINNFSHATQTIGGKSYPLLLRSFFGAPFLAVHDGVIEAAAGSQTPAGFTLPGPSSIYHAMPQMIARSTDQGRTWSVSTLGPPVFTGAGAQTAMGWTPKGGPQGTFLAAYAATPASASSSGLENIVLQRSTDLGRTWTTPVIVDKPSQQFTNFYPQMGVAPDGRVDLVWEDNLHLHDYLFQVASSYSTNGGVTWAPAVQVSDQPINFGLGVSFNSDIRQPPGVASANQYAAFGWADTRLGNAANSNQDDFGDAAQFAPLPAASSAVLPVLSSAFGGLGAAGLVILVLLGVRRRRQANVAPQSGERQVAGAG